jgi:hypothetical protein
MKKVYRIDILKSVEHELEDDATILFVLPNGAELHVTHAGWQDMDNTLCVRSMNGLIAVHPRAGNAVCIEVQDVGNVRPAYRKKSRGRGGR